MAACAHLVPGVTRVPLHVNVVNVTPRIPKPVDLGQHKVKVDAMVFVRTGMQNIVSQLATTQLADGHPHCYMDAAGKKHYGLTTEELLGVLTKVIPQVQRSSPRVRFLVMDRASPHRSEATRQCLAELGVERILLPPHSPDMSPLDSNLFGVVKNRLQREQLAVPQGWPAHAKRFIQLLQQEDSSAHTRGWVGKLEAVVQRNGYAP